MQNLKRDTQNDTIAACATASGGGIGVVRVSGPLTKKIALSILGELPNPRYAKRATFFDAKHEAIDDGLAIYFNAPRSFTGEDVLELHGHGGAMVLNLVLKRTLELGARLAKPGEFSERAFLNNMLDLAQAEAIADLITATSEQAARSAVRSLRGEFSKLISDLKTKLVELRVQVEADIDFPEEEISCNHKSQQEIAIDNLLTMLAQIKDSTRRGILLRDGIKVVILGKPNAGKSSLLNQLTGEETAIVTDIPGTTRDIVHERIQENGIPIHILDTAGLNQSSHPVEKEGVSRALKEAKTADHILYVIDANKVKERTISLSTIANEASLEELKEKNITVIYNKIDLTKEKAHLNTDGEVTSIFLSARTGSGLDLLHEHLKAVAGFSQNDEIGFTARHRHLDALKLVQEHLLKAKEQLKKNSHMELIAEDLRQAQKALSEILGEFSSEDLLRQIFDEFCIGK